MQLLNDNSHSVSKLFDFAIHSKDKDFGPFFVYMTTNSDKIENSMYN